MDSGSGFTSRTNHLLDALPAAESQRLTRSLTPMRVHVKTVLFEPGRTIESVYFPLNGVISLVTPLEDGAIVEVATVGNEGIVGVPLVPGGSLAVRAISQVGGWVVRMDAPTFLKEVGRDGPLRELVNDYLQALFGQISQAAACNRLHSNEERLSRWLLMSHDRVGADEFAITHEFLGQMLGSRRATVTLSAGILQAAGLIRYHRGHVTIVDRAGLESAACECYGVIKRELDGVVQRALRRSAGGSALHLRSAQALTERGRMEISGAASRLTPTVRSDTQRR
jgi:CRP-like cAMP-binding protein